MPQHDHFALGIRIPDDRGRIVGKHAWHRRQVADIAGAMMAAWLVVIE
jgi:hypothetical protein